MRSVVALSLVLALAACDSGKSTTKEAAPAAAPAAPVITHGEWGPRETEVGVVFNKQPTGQSAIWATMKGITRDPLPMVKIGAIELKEVATSDQGVTAAVPAEVIATVGTFPVTVTDRKTGEVVTLGDFVVKPKPAK